MGLHGKQGVDLVHCSIKKLKNRVKYSADQLKIVMMSYLTLVSSTENPTGKTLSDNMYVCSVHLCLSERLKKKHSPTMESYFGASMKQS